MVLQERLIRGEVEVKNTACQGRSGCADGFQRSDARRVILSGLEHSDARMAHQVQERWQFVLDFETQYN